MKQISPPSEDRLLPFLTSCDLFQMLDAAQIKLLATELKWYLVSGGEVFIHEGMPANSIYIVFDGQLELFTCEKEATELVFSEPGPGDVVGELAIVSGELREASVRAKGQATLARLSRADLVRLGDTDPTIPETLTEAITGSLREAKLAQLLSTSNLFSNLSAAVRRDLVGEMEWIILVAGEDFVHQGDRGDFLGVVVSGQLCVFLEEPGKPSRTIGRLRKGSVVGEMALLTGAPRTATVRATRDSELVKLSQSSFQRLMKKYPLELMRVFVGGVIEHLWKHVDTKGQQTGNIGTIAIVPSGCDLLFAPFCERLVQAFAALGSTRFLNSKLVDNYMDVRGISQTSRGGGDDGHLVSWLNAQEFRFDYVLYQADSTMTAWSERCIRQADLVLIVAHGGGQPLKSILEGKQWADTLTSIQSTQALVLIHEDDCHQPRGTVEWRKEHPEIDSHFHVHENRTEDYERLARLLTGRALGVVFSGGGARGAAHVGVLRALEEIGISIDYVGGNSAGSFVAAAYASGYQLVAIPKLIRQAYKPANFFDLTLPVYSLFSGRRGASFYHKVFGENNIEDLWLPFFCVSSNLSRAELVVHDQGFVWKSVLASNSPPGIRPPVIQNGDLLSDGALLDNLPLDVMREKIGSGVIIAVDVSPPLDLVENPDYGNSLSGWRIVWSRLNPFAPSIDLPSISAIIHRANQLGSVRAQRNLVNARLANLYIRPPVEQFSMMDHRRIDEMVTVSYEAAKKQITAWQQGQED